VTTIAERRAAARRSKTRTPSDCASAAFGCAGVRLSEAERAFLREARPFGFILFARNVETPGQLRALVAELRETVGWDAPVMIDQEGGRVARLGAPHWRRHLPVGTLCRRVDAPPAGVAPWEESRLWEALALRGRLIADDLAALGIDLVCAPVLDLNVDGADPIIGDRALGVDPAAVAARGEALCAGFEAGGVTPIIKHIPGHGRARVDSHAALPVVEADRATLAADFAPFAALRDKPAAMTAHIVYSALDPERPATLSPLVINDLIRGELGFDGLLMSDDIGMGALEGPIGRRAAESIAAGCDFALHCSGNLDEMTEVMAETPTMSAESLIRADAMMARRLPPEPFDRQAARNRLDALEREARRDE
jgi:beta-N-acetylhexosaminidase